MKRYAPAALALLVVLVAYAFFAGGGSFTFRRVKWGDTYYTALAEGFFRGHLYTPLPVDARLMALPFPYDYKAREGIEYLWDASYFNGHYYLYHSPLPAVVFYMPYRLLRGAYPRDQLAAVFFSAWAFLAAVAFVWRALRGRRLHVPFPVWILLIGFGNVACFLLMDVRFYEVAIFAGTAMTATWAYALLRFEEKPTILRAVLVGLWLALAIAARPNLGLLLFVTIAVIATATKDRWRALAGAGVPLAIVGAVMVAYNVARFGNPLEFGQSYQLTFIPMQGRTICSLCTPSDLSRFANTVMHYLFWAPSIRRYFPWVELNYAQPDPANAFPMPGSEQVVGIAPLVPLTMLGTLFAILLLLRRERADTGTRAALQVMGAAWLALFGISTCWWIVSRYSMDFMVLMAIASVVCIEAGLTFLQSMGIRLLPLRVAVIALALYSVAIGFVLGFRGPHGSFEQNHHELYEKISRALR